MNNSCTCGVIAVLLFFQLISHASEIDSLKTVLESCEEDSIRLRILNLLVYDIMDTNMAKAEEYFNQLESGIAPFLQTTIGCRYYLNRGLLDYNRSNYDKAISSFIKGAKLADSLEVDELYFWNMNNIANVYGRIGNYNKSLEIQKEIMPLSKKKSINRFSVICVNIAINFASLNQPDSAIYYFRKASGLVEQGSFYHAVILNNLAFLSNNTGDYEQALTYSLDALSMAEKFQKVDFLLECMTNVANSYQGLGDYEKSIYYSKKVEKLARESGMRLQLANALGNLSMAYEGLNNFEKALHYEKSYELLQDSLFAEEANRQINELQIKYETEKKDRRIELQEILLKTKIREMSYISVGAVIILLVSIITVILYITRNRAYKNLVRKNVEMVTFEKRFSVTSQKDSDEDKRYTSSHLSDQKKSELRERLVELMERKKLFLRNDLSLEKLAQKLEINSKYISQLINELFNVSFNDYLNSLRVKEVQRLLLDPGFEHFTMEAISRMAGFNSKSTFNKAFKKFIGLTPSIYQKMSKEIA